jgi:hypothetical protein
LNIRLVQDFCRQMHAKCPPVATNYSQPFSSKLIITWPVLGKVKVSNLYDSFYKMMLNYLAIATWMSTQIDELSPPRKSHMLPLLAIGRTSSGSLSVPHLFLLVHDVFHSNVFDHGRDAVL